MARDGHGETVTPRLHAGVTLAGCGHWTQQERPAEVNAALLGFLAQVDGPARGVGIPRPGRGGARLRSAGHEE